MTSTADLIILAKAFVAAKYDDNYGYSAFTECYGDSEWADFIGRKRSWFSVRADIIKMAELRSSVYEDIMAEADY